MASVVSKQWFASELLKGRSFQSTTERSKNLIDLDTAIRTANEELKKTILTKNGIVSRNSNLDGFIAEQYHVNTFNMNAESTGSTYRADVLLPKDGQTYKKNSVDIVLKDNRGMSKQKYQAKFYKDSEATNAAFKSGNYRGQRKLVPKGQAQDIKGAYEFIEAPDGTKSMALSKQKVKSLQNDVQSGKTISHDWNEYQFKDVAVGIGKQVCYAGMQGAVMGAGFDIAKKLYTGEEIKCEEVIETALKTGADFGVKVAIAGAIKVAVEKDIIRIIPKGTPAGIIANIANIAIENLKVLARVANGELTTSEGLNQMAITTVIGIEASVEGGAIGASIGTVFGPAGAIIGGFVGGVIGYAAGSKFAEKVMKGVQKVREVAWNTFKSISSFALDGIKSLARISAF